MSEESADLGGPRKEWLRLMNHAIKNKYFANGLKEFLKDDYFYVGIMVGLALLQNGQLPVYIPPDILEEVIKEEIFPVPCISELRKGLEKLGILSALRQLPGFKSLLLPDAMHKLNFNCFKETLKPNLSEEGSNRLRFEKDLYHLFINYLREVYSGRRISGDHTITLGDVLAFTTCCTEIPALGFEMMPTIKFVIFIAFSKL